MAFLNNYYLFYFMYVFCVLLSFLCVACGWLLLLLFTSIKEMDYLLLLVVVVVVVVVAETV